MQENLREIVNGGMLPQYIGKKVSVVGLASNLTSNSTVFDLRTVDDVVIKVTLKMPHIGILEGHVEVQGTAQNKQIFCDDLIQFPLEDSLDFDASAHNTLCGFLQSVSELWKTNAD